MIPQKHKCAILFLPLSLLFAQNAGSLVQGSGLLGNVLEGKADTEGRIAKADAELKAKPMDPELLMAAGRARDAVMQYRQSIELYTKAIAFAPGDVRLYRLRGHRYLSMRKFPEAIVDLEKARALSQSSFEAAYYLGLGLYMNGAYSEAANEFARCVNMAGKPDAFAKTLPKGMPSCASLHQNLEFLVAMADWHYRALRRAGRHDEARDLLKSIPNGQQVRDSVSNYRALMFYKGTMKEDQALDGLTGMAYSNASTGIALLHLLEKRTAAACKLLKKAAAEQPWSSFGVISAEVELTRASRGACALFQ
jgi:tetratricopeptide (TPR) repeat protein